MRFIPASVHGFLDYAVGLTLIIAPFALGFKGMEIVLSVAGGAGLIVYSLITDYSVSARRLLPFSVHLAIDFIAALVLIAAPFIFNFGGVAQAFYVVMGVSVIGAVLLTNPNVEDAPHPA
ncbi:MAG: hypothetical protein AAGD92_01010 [Pseudomonadota bacterium]